MTVDWKEVDSPSLEAVMEVFHAILSPDCSEFVVLSQWAHSPHFSSPPIKLGQRLISAAIKGFEARHWPVLDFFCNMDLMRPRHCLQPTKMG